MNTSFKSEEKENYDQYPYYQNLSHSYSHQGQSFKLKLGTYNGPFLAKDIMHCNRSSASLLAAREVLESHQSMSSLIGTLNKETQLQYRAARAESNADSWFSRCQTIENEVKVIQHNLGKLKSDEDRLRTETKSVFRKLIIQNQMLEESFVPLFRNFLKTIREQSIIHRDIEELINFRNVYLDQLVCCEKRIMGVQDMLGVHDTPLDS